MRTLDKHLEEKFKDKNFEKKFDAGKKLVDLAVNLQRSREEKGLSQKELAEMANITQQQVSKIENGINCNILTFLKLCDALKIQIFNFT